MSDDERDGIPAEKLVKNMLQIEGWRCLPAKHQRVDTDSAEIIEGNGEAVRNPDIFAIRQGEAVFVEVKQFRTPVKTRARSQHEHGIRQPKFEDYKTVAEDSGIPLWIFIFESDRGKLLASHISKLSELAPIDAERCKHAYGELLTYFPRTELEKIAIEAEHVPKQFPFAVDFSFGDGLNEVLEGVEAELNTHQIGLTEFSTDGGQL
jgi:hypothetical protein